AIAGPTPGKSLILSLTMKNPKPGKEKDVYKRVL
ncbi:unnamed protein product, partial [marine sediment metagenome]